MSLANYKLLIRNLRTGNIPKHSIFHLIRDFNMTKQELITTTAEKSGLSKADVLRVVDALEQNIHQELANGGEIVLASTGKFKVKDVLSSELAATRKPAKPFKC
ncbi:HU family DNA-binding protein [Paludibacterium denitrificans]|uniref:HU family DNA-binding protein n=1 Tax=Paludibacterium denitrificans TaxID=2675226 RepID=UPI001E350101|nr:HU family DNA-binding protein [Paludibacterium denitrificans]